MVCQISNIYKNTGKCTLGRLAMYEGETACKEVEIDYLHLH